MNTDNKVNTNENIIDFPTDNNKSKSNIFSKHSIILSLIILVLIILIFSLNDNVNFKATDVVKSDPMPLADTGNYSFANYLQGFVMSYNGKTTCYNTNMDKQWEVNSSKMTPKVISNGKYALVYYTNDNKIIVTDGKKTNKIKTDGNVIFATLNSKGYCAAMIAEDGFKNQISVFDKNGKSIYKWHNSDDYIVNIKLSDNNKSMIASSVVLDGNAVKSQIILFNIAKDNENRIIKIGKSTICDIKFVDKNNFVAVLDDKTVCYSFSGRKKWDIDYSDKTLTTYCMSDDNYFTFVFGDDSTLSGSQVCFYNNHGKKLGEYLSTYKIRQANMQKKTSLLLSEDSLLCVSSSGKELSIQKLAYDVKQCYFMGNRKCALIVSNSNAALVPLE